MTEVGKYPAPASGDGPARRLYSTNSQHGELTRQGIEAVQRLAIMRGVPWKRAACNLTDEARQRSIENRKREADGDAKFLYTLIEEIRAEGIASLGGIARALTERGVPSPRGIGLSGRHGGVNWHPTQVRRVLARCDTLGIAG